MIRIPLSRLPEMEPILRPTEENVELSSLSEHTESVSEDTLPSSSLPSESIMSDFQEHTFSSISAKDLPVISIDAVSETPQNQNLRNLIRRFMTRKTEREAIMQEREDFKKNYHSYVTNIGEKGTPPSFYKESMELLGKKVLSPLSKPHSEPLSKRELMTHPSYFSHQERNTLKDLQEYLLSKVEKDPLNENEWWALEQTLCITLSPEDRNMLSRQALQYPSTLLMNKALPLSSWRASLKIAEKASPEVSRDTSLRSEWEQTCDQSILTPINDTTERIKNQQIEIMQFIKQNDAAYLRKTLGHAPSGINDMTPNLNNDSGGATSLAYKNKNLDKAARLKRNKVQKENAYYSDTRKTLEDLSDRLVREAGSAFGQPQSIPQSNYRQFTVS